MMPQRISKKILIYLFVFFTLVTINNTKISNDFYKIKKFNISGLNKIETSKIYDDLIIFKNNNIFSFNKKNISEKIYSNNFVEKFKIFKLYPSTLNVEIKKTKFLAITKKNNKDYLIGTNGKLIEIKDTISNMPFIFGNINVQNFLKFKKAIDKSKKDPLLIIAHQAVLRVILGKLRKLDNIDIPHLSIPLHTLFELELNNEGEIVNLEKIYFEI